MNRCNCHRFRPTYLHSGTVPVLSPSAEEAPSAEAPEDNQGSTDRAVQQNVQPTQHTNVTGDERLQTALHSQRRHKHEKKREQTDLNVCHDCRDGNYGRSRGVTSLHLKASLADLEYAGET